MADAIWNNRFILADPGKNETVLWEGTGWSVGDTGQTLTLSESPLNFRTIRIYGYRPLNSGSTTYSGVFSVDIDIQFLNSNSATNIMIPYSIMSGGNCYVGGMGISGVTTSSWTESGGFHYPIGGSKSNGEYAHVHKVVGINRISGGNS